MFRKVLCLITAAASLFALCSCNGTDTPEETTVEETTTAFESFIISKDNTKLYEKIKDISVQAEDNYCLLKYEDKQYIAKHLRSGNFEAMYELGAGCELLDEATERAGGNYIYFTENGSLKAYFIPTEMALSIVSAPCSNFIMLNVPDNFEIYPYGFIATATEINVVNLAQGSLSSYTKSLADINTFIEAPATLIGENIKTTLTAHSRSQVLITTETLNSKGEVKEKTEITFNPILGVFSAL